MKLIFRSIFLALILGALAAPVGMRMADGGVRVTVNQAQAGGPTVADPCVEVALKIFRNDATCVDNDPAKGGAIMVYLRGILKLLSGAVGLVIVTMIVLGGVQYITSTADAARVKAAKDRIQNAIIGLVLYLTMFAILSFLIPGGILGN